MNFCGSGGIRTHSVYPKGTVLQTVVPPNRRHCTPVVSVAPVGLEPTITRLKRAVLYQFSYKAKPCFFLVGLFAETDINVYNIVSFSSYILINQIFALQVLFKMNSARFFCGDRWTRTTDARFPFEDFGVAVCFHH